MGYLYRHIRLDKNEPFYIGISHKNDNYSRSKSKGDRNNLWKKVVSKTNYEVEIVLESDNYIFLKQKEIEFIKIYGRIDKGTGILSNLTDGGDGTLGNNKPKSEIHRNNIRKALVGKKRPEHVKKAMSRLGKCHSYISREKISKATEGVNNPMYGKKHTKEALDKISKLVLNLETGIFYDSAKEACAVTIYKYDYFKMMLRGDRKNKTNFNYI